MTPDHKLLSEPTVIVGANMRCAQTTVLQGIPLMQPQHIAGLDPKS